MSVYADRASRLSVSLAD